MADLKNNLSSWLKRVRNGNEFVVKDRDTPIAQLHPLAVGNDLDVKEEALVGIGLMRLPVEEKNEDFLFCRHRKCL